VELFLKNHHTDNSTYNRYVGHIEDREKRHIAAANNGEGIRQKSAPDIKVDKVHHMSAKEAPVVEEHPVKQAVNDVADRPSQYSGQAERIRPVNCADVLQIQHDQHRGDQRQNRYQQSGSE